MPGLFDFLFGKQPAEPQESEGRTAPRRRHHHGEESAHLRHAVHHREYDPNHERGGYRHHRGGEGERHPYRHSRAGGAHDASADDGIEHRVKKAREAAREAIGPARDGGGTERHAFHGDGRWHMFIQANAESGKVARGYINVIEPDGATHRFRTFAGGNDAGGKMSGRTLPGMSTSAVDLSSEHPAGAGVRYAISTEYHPGGPSYYNYPDGSGPGPVLRLSSNDINGNRTGLLGHMHKPGWAERSEGCFIYPPSFGHLWDSIPPNQRPSSMMVYNREQNGAVDMARQMGEGEPQFAYASKPHAARTR